MSQLGSNSPTQEKPNIYGGLSANNSNQVGTKKRKCKPRRFTHKARQVFLKAIDEGHSEREAAKLAGVHIATVCRYKIKKPGFRIEVQASKSLRWLRGLARHNIDPAWIMKR